MERARHHDRDRGGRRTSRPLRRFLVVSVVLHAVAFGLLARTVVFRYEAPDRPRFEMAFLALEQEALTPAQQPAAPPVEPDLVPEPDPVPQPELEPEDVEFGYRVDVLREDPQPPEPSIEPPSVPPATWRRSFPSTGAREDRSTDVADGAPAVAEAPPDPEASPVAPRDSAVKRTAPRPRGDNPLPPYPAVARRRGHQGVVLLRVEVSAGGAPLAVRVARSSGHPTLDRAARDAVRSWRFDPAIAEGRPVGGEVDLPVRFRITR